MNRVSAIVSIAIAAPMLCGCNPTPSPSVFSFYDTCAQQTNSFVNAAECGKRTRNSACVEAHNCSAIGDAAVQYADALSEGVQRGEISDAVAKQRWIEFKIAQINHAQNVAMEGAAIMAASAPRTCIPTAYSTTCY